MGPLGNFTETVSQTIIQVVMGNLKRPGGLIGLILVVHMLAIWSGWYENHPWFDIPMHFAGGFGIGWLALEIWSASINKIVFQNHVPAWQRLGVYFFGILGLVTLVGVAWEWYEFIFDSVSVWASLGLRPAQMGLGDTMSDLFLDVLGASVAFVIFRRTLI